MKGLFRICVAILIAAVPVLPSSLRVYEKSVSIVAPVYFVGCFDADPSASGLDRNAHLVWAQRQNQKTIANNLAYKVGLLFNCTEVDAETLINAFVDITVIAGTYAPDPACFGNDRSANGRERAPHETWARTKTRNEIRDNLQWKVATAANCLEARTIADYFADVSVAISKAASGTPTGPTTTGLNGTWKGETLLYDFVQNGSAFTWRVTNNPNNLETANGQVYGNRLRATFSGANGTATVDGTIIVDGNGRPMRINWDNGAVFTRQR